MIEPTSCPEPDALKALLEGIVTPAEEAPLSDHLEQCPRCQEALLNLTASGDSWAGVARSLGQQPEPVESALREALVRIAAAPTHSTDTQADVPRAGELALDFLDPPADPGHLGRLDRYDVLGVIGRGGMGVVLRAFDPALERIVAIKVLAPQLACQDTSRKRFLREARAAAKVNHDNVVTIHEVSEVKGLPYLVMEFVPGTSLAGRLASGPMTTAEVLRIAIPTARGLAAAHAQGLVHRDVKPANILLEEGSGRVKLTDFGLARAADDASVTQSGVVAGTPQFMAPEQARGEPFDQRADLFSLGSVLYAMCSGRAPFDGGTPLAVMRRVSDEVPPPIAEVNPSVPRWLAAIITTLHARSPADRFQSAADVADLLERHQAQLQRSAAVPVAAPLATPVRPVPAPRRRSRRPVLVAGIAALLIAGLGVSAYEFGLPPFRRAPAPKAPDPAPADPQELAGQVREVLAAHCYRCHGENGTVEGGFNYLMDRDRLIARKKIVPGHPDQSRLLRRVIEGEMPPGEEKSRPSKEEVALLERWVAAGAPPLVPVAAERPFVASTRLADSIRADLAKRDKHDRPFTRYFTLTHLRNAGLSEDELQTYRNGLSKLLNSLSWKKKIVVPVAVDAARTVLRIDLRDYGWTERQWETLLAVYPYGTEGGSATDDPPTAAVRGDWFVATAARPPLYHDLLGLPKHERELEKLLHINVADDIRSERVARAGFNGSGVSRNNRLIERHETPYGAYWKTYDFSESTGTQNLFERPLGPGEDDRSFRHAGGEILFNLPNGLQGYMLVNGKGDRIDKGPTDIVSDPRRPDRAVENGLSCMACHSRGINAKEDQIRAHVKANPKAFPNKEEVETILALYPPAEKVAPLLRQDAKRFREAAAATGAKVGATEPILALASQFEAPLDLRRAAAEAGLPPKEFLTRLEKSSKLGRAIGALRLPGGTVQRATFTKDFAEMAREGIAGTYAATASPESGGTTFRLGEGRPLPPYIQPSRNIILDREGLRTKDRSFARTKSAGYLDRDFKLEIVLVMSNAKKAIAFVGIGAGEPSRAFADWGESRDAVTVRMHAPGHLGGQVQLTNRAVLGTRFGSIRGPGPHRVTIEKKGNAVRFAVDVKDDGPSPDDLETTIPDLRAYAPFLTAANSYLFFGDGATYKIIRLTESKGTAPLAKLPEMVEEPPPPVIPPIPEPKLADRVEVKLPEPFAQVRTGGAGRFLIFHLKKAQKLAVFDVSKAKVVHQIDAPDDVLYAAGLDKLFVVVPAQRLLQRWDLQTGRREKTVPFAEASSTRAALMGCNARDPLLLFYAGKFVPWDAERMEPSGADVTGLGGDPKYNFQARISADGRSLTVWHGGLSGQQYGLVRLRRPKNTFARSPDAHSFNERWAMPSADGSMVFRFGSAIYDDQMRPLGTGSVKGVALLPTEDPRFFLAVQEETRDTNKVLICASADRQVIFQVGGVEKMTGSSLNSRWGQVNGEPRVHYLPTANVLVNLPERNDRVVLRPLNLFDALNRSGKDYLFVLSRPKSRVTPGTDFAYHLDVRSKAGGLKFELEAGPRGMTVSDAGVVRWAVPKDFAGRTVRVIVTIRSGSGKEVQHSFELNVVGPGPAK